jgi:tetratricopeptide (TPR) repeat protein
VSQPLSERTFYTEQDQLIGTPEYMSPEQADRSNQDIDTRTDIYSLGVMLYELLSGALPFDPQTFREGRIDRICQVICEEDPDTPSIKLSKTSVEESGESARRRRTNAKALQRRLHGDLDWVTLKAMEKDRTRRYGSAGELAADVQRHLNHEPVLAGPPSTLYRVKKFVRRHKAFVTGVAAVLVVLVTGIVVSTLLAVGQARARAEAQAVSDFLLNNVLRSLDLWDMRGQEITVRSILDTASQDLEGKLVDEPLVEASIRWTLAASYTWLGLYEPAELHAKRALEIRQAQLGAEHLDTLLSVFELGWLYFFQSRYNEAELLLTKALEGMKPVLNEGHAARLHCTAVLGYVYNMQGRFPEAQQLFEGVLFTVHQVWGEESEHSPTILQGLGLAYQMQGRYEEMFTFGDLCRELGRYDQAEQLLVEALDRTRRVRGEQHSHILWTMDALARLYLEQDRYEEAEQLFSKALDGMSRVRGRDHKETLGCMNGLAVLYTKQKRYNEAESLFNEVLEGKQFRLGKDHPDTLETKNDLAVLYKKQAKYEEAEPLLLEAIDGRRLKLGDAHPHTLESWNNLIDLYESWDKPEKAEEWRAKLPQTESVEQ